jgi:hypothetical protein
MTPDQEEQLIHTVTKVGTKMDLLISDDGSSGMVPEVKRAHIKLDGVVVRHGEQLAYYKGAIALAAVLFIVFGGVLLAHILGGK